MATQVLSGSERQVVHGADLYDARGLRVVLDQWAGPNSAANVTSSPPGAVFRGGQGIGGNRNRTEARQTLYKRGPGSGNGASVRMEDSPECTVLGHYSEYAWDPIKFSGSTRDWTIERCLCRNARDDAIEDDVGYSGIVRKSAFLDCHSLLSVTPGGSAPLSGPCTIRFEDCLFSSGNLLADGSSAWRDRDDRNYAWGHPNGGSQIFKVRGYGPDAGGGAGITIELYRCAFMVRYGIVTTKANLRFFQDMALRGEGNVFYYLGDFRALTKVALKGGFVPAEYELGKHPEVWARVSNDAEEWADLERNWVAAWKADQDLPIPDPDPKPDPDTDPQPTDDVDAGLAAMDQGVARLRGGTNCLLIAPPPAGGDLARAAKNTGILRIEEVLAALRGLAALVGKREAVDQMAMTAAILLEDREKLNDAVLTSDTATAVAMIRDDLVRELEARAPEVRAEVAEPEPEPDDCEARIDAATAPLLAEIERLQDALDDAVVLGKGYEKALRDVRARSDEALTLEW